MATHRIARRILCHLRNAGEVSEAAIHGMFPGETTQDVESAIAALVDDGKVASTVMDGWVGIGRKPTPRYWPALRPL